MAWVAISNIATAVVFFPVLKRVNESVALGYVALRIMESAIIVRSGLVPRRMALLGLIGGPLAFVGGVLVLFGAIEDPSAALFAFTIIEIVWEASLAIYLTVKGYRPSPILADAAA